MTRFAGVANTLLRDSDTVADWLWEMFVRAFATNFYHDVDVFLLGDGAFDLFPRTNHIRAQREVFENTWKEEAQYVNDWLNWARRSR